MPLHTKSSAVVNGIGYPSCFMSPCGETSIWVTTQAFITSAFLPREGRNWWLWFSNFCTYTLWPGSQQRRHNLFLSLQIVESLAWQALPSWGRFGGKVQLEANKYAHLAAPSHNLLLFLSRLEMIFWSHLPDSYMYFSIVSIFLGKESSFGAPKSKLSWNIIIWETFFLWHLLFSF